MTSFSKTELFNTALLKVGANRIDSAVSTNPLAVVCEDNYKACRTYLLASYQWGFARAKVSLAKLSSFPEGPYTNGFALPADLIAVIPAAMSNARYIQADDRDLVWEVQGNVLYTDEDTFTLEYIKDFGDQLLNVPPHFFEALASELAKRISERLNSNMLNILTSEAERKLRKAIMQETRSRPPHPRAAYSKLTDLRNR